jgi:hypothetical protein
MQLPEHPQDTAMDAQSVDDELASQFMMPPEDVHPLRDVTIDA